MVGFFSLAPIKILKKKKKKKTLIRLLQKYKYKNTMEWEQKDYHSGTQPTKLS